MQFGGRTAHSVKGLHFIGLDEVPKVAEMLPSPRLVIVLEE